MASRICYEFYQNHFRSQSQLLLLRAKLFRESFFALKFTLRQTQFYNPDFWSDCGNFFYRNGPFLLFGSNFTSFDIGTKKIFRFELLNCKFFDFKFIRFDCFYEKLFLGEEHLAPKRPLRAKLFQASFLALTVPPVYRKYAVRELCFCHHSCLFANATEA